MKLPEGSRGYVARKPPPLAPCAEEGMPFHKIVVPTTDTISALFATTACIKSPPRPRRQQEGLELELSTGDPWWSTSWFFQLSTQSTHRIHQDSQHTGMSPHPNFLKHCDFLKQCGGIKCFASCCFLFNVLCRHVGNMFILKQLNAKHFHSLFVGCTGTGKTIAVQEAFGSQHDVQSSWEPLQSWEKCVAHCILQHEESQGKWMKMTQWWF